MKKNRKVDVNSLLVKVAKKNEMAKEAAAKIAMADNNGKETPPVQEPVGTDTDSSASVINPIADEDKIKMSDFNRILEDVLKETAALSKSAGCIKKKAEEGAKPETVDGNASCVEESMSEKIKKMLTSGKAIDKKASSYNTIVTSIIDGSITGTKFAGVSLDMVDLIYKHYLK